MQEARFGTTLRRVARENDSIGVAFGPKPPEADIPQNEPLQTGSWQGVVVNASEEGLASAGDLVVLVRRPSSDVEPFDSCNNWDDPSSRYLLAYLVLDHQLNAAKRLVSAVDRFASPKALEKEIDESKLTGLGDDYKVPSDPHEVQPRIISARHLEQTFQQEFLLGNSMLSALSRTPRRIEVEHRGTNILPLRNLLGTQGGIFRDAVLSHLSSNTRLNLEAFLQQVPLSVLAITGPPGSGKTDCLASIVNLCLDQERLDRVLVHCTDSQATARLCRRADKLNKFATDSCNRNIPLDRQRRYALVVNGHSNMMDLHHVLDYVCLGLSESVPTRRKLTHFTMHLSLCEWVLKLVGYQQYSLDPLDSKTLHASREDYLIYPHLRPLREFFCGEKTWKEIVQDWKTAGQTQDKHPTHLLQKLMRWILLAADVLGTTTEACDDELYAPFIKATAKVNIVDNAETLNIPGLLMGWQRLTLSSSQAMSAK